MRVLIGSHRHPARPGRPRRLARRHSSRRMRGEHPTLIVNEGRHCLESYFIDPAEIGAALISQDRDLYGPNSRSSRTFCDPQGGLESITGRSGSRPAGSVVD